MDVHRFPALVSQVSFVGLVAPAFTADELVPGTPNTLAKYASITGLVKSLLARCVVQVDISVAFGARPAYFRNRDVT
jgi:hypothetical protein